ncbi:putative endo-1,3(4)-beta-glucanase [Aspergillus brunneoviolaceus CBS 621.78]|uniref:Uncharacterized protein n=1 Tax=Aspergillus brunneoviolaceus CBS 621.78 TaxID=1450534 RepID=A0ACD1G6X0_9EURO|nr:hypothetical protein BO95DRAFT_482838 [Aspergillus brunneoviolaceus CBS 621.78]RAH44965.1 hypothetical protein BO95DRAFT_482838 [Aspergillus brunneoviolaceus CBS 621.78]
MSDHNPPVPPAGTEPQPQPQQFPPNRLSPPRLLRLPNGTTTKQYLEHAFKPLRVDESLIRNPNPFTLYIGLWGRTNYVAKTEMGAYRRLENMRRHTGRAPTQPEMDAMLEMMAQSARRSCLGLPLGALAGLAHQAYVLRYSADWEAYFAPQVQETPAGKKVLTLEGFKRGWQMMGDAGAMGGGRPMAAARLFKVAVWTLVADFVASSWATFGEIAMWRGDARLERVREEMERSKHAVRLSTSPGARAVSGGDTSEEGQRRRETSAAYALVVAGELREGPSEVDGAGAGDDGSPVAHGMEEDYAFNSGGGGDEHGSRTNSYSEVTPRARAWNTRTQQQQQQRQTPSSSGGGDFFDDDDDASPVAVEHRRPAGGSAWDRLRMNAARPQSRPQQTEWSRAERESESESHSERERAQADFDRMLDAERNAGSDSGRRSGRWSSW